MYTADIVKMLFFFIYRSSYLKCIELSVLNTLSVSTIYILFQYYLSILVIL